MIAQHKKQKEEEIYGAMTFQPEINLLSKELGKKSSLWELYRNPKGRYVKDKVKSHVERKESEECSFTPEISKSQQSYQKLFGGGGGGHGNCFHSPLAWNDDVLEQQQEGEEEAGYDCPVVSGERGRGRGGRDGGGRGGGVRGVINLMEPEKMAKEIRIRLQEKEDRRQQELILKEIEELKECTFQPKITNSRSQQQQQHTQQQRPVVIKGLGRHLELRNLLKKQKELETRRKEEAFHVRNVEKYRSSVDGLTIVQVDLLPSLPFPRLLIILLPSFPPLSHFPLLPVAVSFARKE
jgi:hypothetical protein